VENGRCHCDAHLDVEQRVMEDGARRACSSSLRVADAMLLDMCDGVVNFSRSRNLDAKKRNMPRANARRLCPTSALHLYRDN
jgi:hypothetical protein